jgi:hypothetical protein
MIKSMGFVGSQPWPPATATPDTDVAANAMPTAPKNRFLIDFIVSSFVWTLFDYNLCFKTLSKLM